MNGVDLPVVEGHDHQRTIGHLCEVAVPCFAELWSEGINLFFSRTITALACAVRSDFFYIPEFALSIHSVSSEQLIVHPDSVLDIEAAVLEAINALSGL